MGHIDSLEPPGYRRSAVPTALSPSAAPAWLVKLQRVLLRADLPVRELTTGGGMLRIVLADDHQQRLVANIRAKREGVHGVATTDRFVIGYDGAGKLTGVPKQWLTTIFKILRRIGDRLPNEFAEHAGLFSDQVPAEQRFLHGFPFCNIERTEIGTESFVEVLIRTTTTCNQQCPFCSAPPYDSPSDEVMARCIDAAATLFPSAMLTLTGGEPTLRSAFADEVRQALAHSTFSHLQVQTNAVSFAKKIDPTQLPNDSRLFFFVSLHGTVETVYDPCTGTSGQLPLALDGTQKLLRAGHRVSINCVVSSLNFDHLEDFVRSLPTLLPIGSNWSLHFSTLLCPEHNPQTAELLVRYPALAQRLEQVAQLATELGIRMQSLRAASHAAIPACMLQPEWRNFDPHRPRIQDDETGFEDFTRPWVKADRCRQCVEADWCRGVPLAYAKQFGLDELRPLEPAGRC